MRATGHAGPPGWKETQSEMSETMTTTRAQGDGTPPVKAVRRPEADTDASAVDAAVRRAERQIAECDRLIEQLARETR